MLSNLGDGCTWPSESTVSRMNVTIQMSFSAMEIRYTYTIGPSVAAFPLFPLQLIASNIMQYKSISPCELDQPTATDETGKLEKAATQKKS